MGSNSMKGSSSHFGAIYPRDLVSRVREIVEKSVLFLNNLPLLPHPSADGRQVARS